jgi:beta-lactamase class A
MPYVSVFPRLSLLLFVMTLLLFLMSGTSAQAFSILHQSAPVSRLSPEESYTTKLRKLVADYNAEGGRASIMVRDNARNFSLGIHELEPRYTGSIYKVFVMWKVMEDISTGRLTEETSIPYYYYDDYNPIFDEAIIDGEITVGDALEQMIYYSDNSAAWSLGAAVDWPTIDGLLESHGFYVSRVMQEYPVSTAYELLQFYERLFNRKLDSHLTGNAYKRMMSLLKGQQVNWLLSKGLPAKAVFAHKPGFFDEYLNDSGILFSPDGRPIYLIVLTSGGDGITLMQQVARLTWEELALNPPVRSNNLTGIYPYPDFRRYRPE